MNFGTLISQVGPVKQAVNAIPTYENIQLYWQYIGGGATGQWVQDPISLLPYTPNTFIGYGKVDIIGKWNQELQDTKEFAFKINLYADDSWGSYPDYTFDKQLGIYVKDTTDIPAARFDIEMLPFPPAEGSPTTDILILNLFIERASGIYEVLP